MDEPAALKKPVILIVDDEPVPLEAMSNALVRRYGEDYRVISHSSPRAALDDLERLKGEDEPVALLIADQWMPEMTGAEFFEKAHDIHSAAQRALLVTWGDRSASTTILQACAFNVIENYILKPWSPPEVHLYPLIGEFLSSWTRAHRPRMELVKVISEDPSPRAHEVCQFLERNGIPYGAYPADSAAGRRLLDQIGLDSSRLPAVIMLDGRVLVDPPNAELADELGVTNLEERHCDLAVVGAGPAGLAAAVYGASEGLRTLVIEHEMVGGQAGSSSLIRNYLGFPRGISGSELAQRAYQQAWLFGAKFVLAREVTGLRAVGTDRLITFSDGTEITTRAVLIATGSTYRRLNLPALERFIGAGVFYAAGSETLIMKDHDVVVIGGGNAAGQAVNHLAKSARRVTLVVRGDSLESGMSDYLTRQIRHLSNVEVRLQAEVVNGDGHHRLERVVVRNLATGAEEALEVSALFVLIGAHPHTEWLAASVARDKQSYILTGDDLDQPETARRFKRLPMRFETSMPGVFAAGDVRAGSVKRIASAVGEGAIAVRLVHEYLSAPVSL
jgi:thioredoxin reductase (NADPH)